MSSIGGYAFANCPALASIIVEEGNQVFDSRDNCNAVILTANNALLLGCKNTIIPSSVTGISDRAFYGSSDITNMTIPSSVQSIGEGAFYGCDQLISVIVEAEQPFEIKETSFTNKENTTLYVPIGCVPLYEQADYWKEFGKIVESGTVITDTDRLYCDNTDINIGYTASIQIGMSNEHSFTACQFDLILPEGITIAKDNKDQYIVKKSDRYSDHSQQAVIEELGNNTYRISCNPTEGATINGTEGLLLTIDLKAEAGMDEGTYNAIITRIVLIQADGTKMRPQDVAYTIKATKLMKGDANGDNIINMVDVDAIINYINGNPSTNFNILTADMNDDGEIDVFDVMKVLTFVLTGKLEETHVDTGTTEDKLNIENLSISAGEEKALVIKLEDDVAYAGIQFDLYLPENLSFIDYSLNQLQLPENSKIAMTKQENGSYRFLIASMDKEEIRSIKDGIITITVFANENLASGELTGFFRNIKLSKSDGSGDKYDETPFSITILAPSVVKAKSYERAYGETNPIYGYTVEGGELNGNPEITCEATEKSPVGTYDIVITRGTETNYNVTYVKGTLTVEQAPLSVKAGTYTIKQGEALPVFELTYEGFKNNETEAVLTKKPTLSCDAKVGSSPGEYEIKIFGAEAQNYSITYTPGKLIVTEADPVTITAKNYTKAYGDANPTFEYEVSGATLDGTPDITCEATAASPVGTYDIIVKQGSVTNYNVSYVKGTLTITKAPLSVKAGTYTKKQGEDNPEFTLTYDGFKNGETEAVLTKKPIASCTATKESAPNEYVVTVSGGEAQNYEFEYINGSLTVTEALGIDELIVSGEPFNVYNATGQRVASQTTTLKYLPSGLYIIAGKKVFVK